jgi:hypothetical protein
MKKQTMLSIFILGIILLATMSVTVYASTFYVKVLDPSSNGAKGVSSGGYWVGEIPIKVGTSEPPTEKTMSFCMDFDKVIYIGETYSATLNPVPDDATWKAIGYLLTWYYPATSNNAAAVDQVAIWKTLDGSAYHRESWLDININNDGVALAGVVAGKDVVRTSDSFDWITPSSVTANPGDIVTFQAKVLESDGVTGRANVKVLFSAVGSTIVNPTETLTDSAGIATVQVTVPSNAAHGSTIEVKASTRGVWPQKYIDVQCNYQDLIGMGTSFELTIERSVYVLAYIHVVPESPLGALSAVCAFAAAFVLWSKFKHPKAQISA